MTSIHDSEAVLVFDRVLPQHQAALTLIKDRLEDPSVPAFRWLDLACGRGQILLHAENAISTPRRQKVQYVGVDVENRFARDAKRIAERLFTSPQMIICDLHRFESLLAPTADFNFITFTNTAHEVTPTSLAETLVSAICRIADNGELFMYDMEQLATPELGAIPWSAAEMESVVHGALRAAGETAPLPAAAVWRHTSCTAWSLHINHRNLTLKNGECQKRRRDMLQAASERFAEVLRNKLLAINRGLEALCQYGPETPEEAKTAQRLTYDYWAVSRALDGPLILGSEPA
jgi:SAM-dependent methyltransferase